MLKSVLRFPPRRIELLISLVVLVFIVAFTLALFFLAPYPGFTFVPSNGQVSTVFIRGGLEVGDQITQIGRVLLGDYTANTRQSLYKGVQPGQVLPIRVRRKGQIISIPWVFPGPTLNQVAARLMSQWLLPFVFWGVGTMTLLSLRPKDVRWRLLVAFNFLTAIWLAAGLLSPWRIWESGVVLRAGVWLSVPVYLFLHWMFPSPLGPLPAPARSAGYLIGIALAAAEWFQILPQTAYFFGFLVAMAGSLVLLIVHFILQPAQRRDIGLLAVAGGVALLPSIGLGLAGLFGTVSYLAAGAVLAFPVLPLAYFYIVYRRQLGGLEFRVNRLLSLYLFLILLGTALIIAVPLADTLADFPGETTLITLASAILVVPLAVFGFSPFQRFVERRLLSIPLPSTYLLETYANRITTRLDTPSLARLLTAEILPSLLVRQFAFLRFDEANRVSRLCAFGVASDQFPTDRDIPGLLAQAGKYGPPVASEAEPRSCAWVRLALPLYLGAEPIGLWLLGRRDPDDFYAQAEISTLQALANQTAIALSYIVQAERVRALYQASIEQHETERTTLALELHDEILNQLAVLSMNTDERDASSRFQESYQTLVARVRQMISGLRPAMLDYGLPAALEALADDLTDRAGGQVAVRVDLPTSDARYPPQMEQHLYRIVQQAAENALRHAHARTIRIHGRLEPEQVDVTVEDDGVGFAGGEALDLSRLVAHKHFGLAGMFERAALIGGAAEIDSAPGRGARVRVIWHPPAKSF